MLSLVLLLGGCATRVSVSDPFLTVVWGDAYTLECEGGQAMLVDGEYVCPNGDSIEVRGGHIGETFKGLMDGLFQLVGGLVPRGVSS
jgi:hypothetical protein